MEQISHVYLIPRCTASLCSFKFAGQRKSAGQSGQGILFRPPGSGTSSSSSSSLEMVELQSDPTVMLDPGLSPSSWAVAAVTRPGVVPVLLETLPWLDL